MLGFRVRVNEAFVGHFLPSHLVALKRAVGLLWMF